MLDKKYIINQSASGRDALKRLNDIASIDTLQAVLFVVNDKEELQGSLSDGDIRRGLINGLSIDSGIMDFMFATCRYLTTENYTSENINALKEKRIRFVPFVDNDKRITRIVDLEKLKAYLPLDVVIMAGGKGERLMPLTQNCPKPLLKVGGKPIIEHNIDRLAEFGIVNFNITLKYLGQQVVDYFGNGENKGIYIQYLFEESALGTIGAVSKINNWKHDYVLIMNSDLLTNLDLKDFFEYFLSNNADMAVASVPYYINVPYAVFELSDGKQIASLTEKPSYTYYSNAGIYLVKKEMLKAIPMDKKFDATDFMDALIKQKRKLVSYPITSYWLDIGRMEDYTKAQEDIKHIKL